MIPNEGAVNPKEWLQPELTTGLMSDCAMQRMFCCSVNGSDWVKIGERKKERKDSRGKRAQNEGGMDNERGMCQGDQ